MDFETMTKNESDHFYQTALALKLVYMVLVVQTPSVTCNFVGSRNATRYLTVTS